MKKSDHLHTIFREQQAMALPRRTPKALLASRLLGILPTPAALRSPFNINPFFFLPDANRGLSPCWHPDPPQHLRAGSCAWS